MQGDADSRRLQFGAHIMMHAPGTATNMQLQQVEVREAGQAFRLGRYPVHLHMNGAKPDTYVVGCAIHHTYNRALTMHGTNETLIKDNVAFDSMGHQFFVEDGSEALNTFDGNLGILARQSHALLSTDVTPANFWITNPNNTVINNVAAGSTAGYGFWYRCEGHSRCQRGPSETGCTRVTLDIKGAHEKQGAGRSRYQRAHQRRSLKASAPSSRRWGGLRTTGRTPPCSTACASSPSSSRARSRAARPPQGAAPPSGPTSATSRGTATA